MVLNGLRVGSMSPNWISVDNRKAGDCGVQAGDCGGYSMVTPFSTLTHHWRAFFCRGYWGDYGYYKGGVIGTYPHVDSLCRFVSPCTPTFQNAAELYYYKRFTSFFHVLFLVPPIGTFSGRMT